MCLFLFLAFFSLFFLLTSAPTLPICRKIAGFAWHRNIPTLVQIYGLLHPKKLTCERFEAKVSLAFFGLFFSFLLTSAPTLPIRREIAGFSWHRNIPTLADETSPRVYQLNSSPYGLTLYSRALGKTLLRALWS